MMWYRDCKHCHFKRWRQRPTQGSNMFCFSILFFKVIIIKYILISLPPEPRAFRYSDWCVHIYIYLYVCNTHAYICVHIYIYIHMVRVPCSVFPTPPWDGSPGSTPFPSICKLLAAFLRSSLVFARSLQHFWLPATHTHTHIHTYTHTHIHTYTHTHTHAHTRMHACIALHYITLHYIHQTPHHHRPQGVKTIRSKTGHASPTSQTLHHHRPWGGTISKTEHPSPFAGGADAEPYIHPYALSHVDPHGRYSSKVFRTQCFRFNGQFQVSMIQCKHCGRIYPPWYLYNGRFAQSLGQESNLRHRRKKQTVHAKINKGKRFVPWSLDPETLVLWACECKLHSNECESPHLGWIKSQERVITVFSFSWSKSIEAHHNTVVQHILFLLIGPSGGSIM